MSAFSYTVEEGTNVVRIFQDGTICVTQPFHPETFEPFASVEEATAWGEALIAERESWLNAPVVEEEVAPAVEEETPLAE